MTLEMALYNMDDSMANDAEWKCIFLLNDLMQM